MVNSRHNSPIREVASPSSDVTIEEMFSSIMKEIHEVRGNVNAMQGGFAAFHEDISLLRDRVRHNHSIAPSDREKHGRSSYKSRYHDDGLVRGIRRERVSRLYEEPPRRSENGEFCRIPGLEREIVREVACSVRIDPFDRRGGGDINQTFTSLSCKGTSSSFHTPKVSHGLCPDAASSSILIQSDRRKNREREKRLESESAPKKPRECEKRLECEMKKSRESGGGERKDKHQMREKPQAQVSEGCLLDSKVNLGWALDNPLPFALGEEYKPLPTNTSCMSFCVDEFVGNKSEDTGVEHHVALGLETTLPVMDQEEQGQVEELLAQGSSALTLSPFDAPLNVVGLEKLICVDRFVIVDVCDMWHQELKLLNHKSIFASYVDPFLINPSIDRHEIFRVDSILNVGMTSFHTKITKLSFVGDFVLHEYVDGNSRTKRSEIIDEFRTWCLLYFHCKMIKPFNGIGMFYGRFVKDFATHMSHVGCVVINGITMYCSHICAHILKLLGQLSEIPFDKIGLLIDISSCKLDMNCDEPTLCVAHKFVNLWNSNYLGKNEVLMVVNGLPLYDLKIRAFMLRLFLVIFNYAYYKDAFLCTSSPNENVKSIEKMLKFARYRLCAKMSHIFFIEILHFKLEQVGMDTQVLEQFVNHVLTCEVIVNHATRVGSNCNILDLFGGCCGLHPFYPFYRPMILDIFVFTLVGTRVLDLRTNPFQGEEDDMTTHDRNQVSLRRREPWIDWGPRMRPKTLQGSYNSRWPPEDDRKGERSDLRTNPFQEGEDDTIMGGRNGSDARQDMSFGVIRASMRDVSIMAITLSSGLRLGRTRYSREALSKTKIVLLEDSREIARPGDLQGENARPGVLSVFGRELQKVRSTGRFA